VATQRILRIMSTSSLIDVLPGMPMPVAEVTRTLAHMWDAEPGHAGEALSDFRASQMNLILHLGLSTSVGEARELFDTAIQFAQRYPCRIIVLCPHPPEREDRRDLLTGKLYTQCFIGTEQREMCCCEALILGYSTEESDFLENQISLWLESDLPVYHWLHRVPAERIERHYKPFLSRCQRVLFDSAHCGADYATVAWPEPRRVRDLALARTLPMRQSLGQFLSNIEPARLVDGLARVEVSGSETHTAEARHLLAWLRARLKACAGADADAIEFALEGADMARSADVGVEWRYAKGTRYFTWEFHAGARAGRIACDFGGGRMVQPLHIECMKPSAALAEALFF